MTAVLHTAPTSFAGIVLDKAIILYPNVLVN